LSILELLKGKEIAFAEETSYIFFSYSKNMEIPAVHPEQDRLSALVRWWS